MFCLMAQIGVQEVQGVQKVQIRSIRLIRLIRGRKGRTHPAAYCPPGSICDMLSIPRALPPVTQGSALQAPKRLRDTSDVTTILIGYDDSYSALLPGGQYHE